MTSQETLASKLNSSKPYSVACVYGCMNEFGQQRWGEFIDLSWNMDDQCSYVSHINECKKNGLGIVLDHVQATNSDTIIKYFHVGKTMS